MTNLPFYCKTLTARVSDLKLYCRYLHFSCAPDRKRPHADSILKLSLKHSALSFRTLKRRFTWTPLYTVYKHILRTTMHSVVLNCTTLHSIVLYSTPLYSSALWGTPLHSEVLHCTPLYSTLLRSENLEHHFTSTFLLLLWL